MRKADVLARFGNNESEVARALKITRASVNAWGTVVPYASAKQIHELKPEIPFDPSLYDKWLKPLRQRSKRSNHTAA